MGIKHNLSKFHQGKVMRIIYSVCMWKVLPGKKTLKPCISPIVLIFTTNIFNYNLKGKNSTILHKITRMTKSFVWTVRYYCFIVSIPKSQLHNSSHLSYIHNLYNSSGFTPFYKSYITNVMHNLVMFSYVYSISTMTHGYQLITGHESSQM